MWPSLKTHTIDQCSANMCVFHDGWFSTMRLITCMQINREHENFTHPVNNQRQSSIFGLARESFHLTACQCCGWLQHDLDLRWDWGVKAVWQQYMSRSEELSFMRCCAAGYAVSYLHSNVILAPLERRVPHTSFTIAPFLLAAKLVCRVVVSVVDQAELPCEHVHSIPDKQVVGLQAIVSRPPQEYSLVLHIKLCNEETNVNTDNLNIYNTQNALNKTKTCQQNASCLSVDTK